jgi:L-histidine Nalpha-methyltransferase
MIANKQPLIPAIADEVYEGLTGTPKSLPPKLFYDDAGSALFEEITRLPEYYLTRTERAILCRHAQSIARAMQPGTSVVELGAGNGEKTGILLEALGRRNLRVNYFPVELSQSAVAQAKQQLEAQFQFLQVHPVVEDFCADLRFIRQVPPPRLVLYIGSSIGNLDASHAQQLLCDVRAELAPGDVLLLGTDLVKDVPLLLSAYDDPQGVTARFNLNLLARINRELGGHFELESFRHIALWNHMLSRMEMHLESVREQQVRIDLLDLNLHFAAGERIHTENSHKYTVESGRAMLQRAGFSLARTFTDERRWFAVHLARC